MTDTDIDTLLSSYEIIEHPDKKDTINFNTSNTTTNTGNWRIRVGENIEGPTKAGRLLIERFNGTFVDMISMHINTDQDDWDVFFTFLFICISHIRASID